MDIGYCQKCNIPIRGESCGICHSSPSSLKFHDFGDIRPALSYERKILLSLIPYKEMKSYLRRRLILLSKQPGLDYRKDVFLDGFKFGTLEYIKDIRWRWRFIPTGKGAALIYHVSKVYDLEIQPRGHMKGKKINKEIDCDWKIAKIGKCVGSVVREEKGSKNVAFSGGKDSEVVLYLAHLAGVERAVYLNTGLEFPETERFVYNFADFLGVELIELRPSNSFWDFVKEKGIPTKDRRWCTKYLKLEQLKN
mgnify:CR=1 FL=1